MRRRFALRVLGSLALLPALGLNCLPNIGGGIADTLDYFFGFPPGDAIVRASP